MIETVNDDPEVKKNVFAEIAASVRRDAIIASNTAVLALSDFVQSIDNPGRVIGMHFFHPLSLQALPYRKGFFCAFRV